MVLTQKKLFLVSLCYWNIAQYLLEGNVLSELRSGKG
jgi:hypothetical protein